MALMHELILFSCRLEASIEVKQKFRIIEMEWISSAVKTVIYSFFAVKDTDLLTNTQFQQKIITKHQLGCRENIAKQTKIATC